MSSFEEKSKIRVFDGYLTRFTHHSPSTKTTMTCAVYIPITQGTESKKFPTLLYLSGLTCTDENVCQKSGVFRALSSSGLAFVAPDTSPRGAGVAGETDSWDFGVGAGFYLDATTEGWKNNYNMYSYITKDLLEVLRERFPSLDLSRMGITGHSMGGHGALTIAMKNPSLFKSVSAFAPICNPMNCPWGQKAFQGYLGADRTAWEEYDACALVKKTKSSHFDDILVDVGLADSFLTAGQLLPDALQKACEESGQRVTINYREGFDHSYYFISSFIDDHVQFHAARLV